jgi:hypothetical protein
MTGMPFHAAGGIVRWLCHGPAEQMLIGMVAARGLDGPTLQQLAARIEQAKRQDKRHKTKEEEGAGRDA